MEWLDYGIIPVKGLRVRQGSSWLHHLSLQDFPDLPGIPRAIKLQFLAPNLLTSWLSTASSSGDHGPFTLPLVRPFPPIPPPSSPDSAPPSPPVGEFVWFSLSPSVILIASLLFSVWFCIFLRFLFLFSCVSLSIKNNLLLFFCVWNTDLPNCKMRTVTLGLMFRILFFLF